MTTLTLTGAIRLPCAWISSCLGGYALAGGLLTLLGWALDIHRLTDWNNTGISQMPNNALGMAAAGAAIILLSAGMRRTAAAFAAVAGLIGAATLFEYITGIDLGIDRLLVFREWGQRGTVVPGRMGIPGSVSQTIIGLSIILSNDKRTRRLAVGGGLVVIAIAMLSLIGYLFRADPLYTIPRLTTIACQTATMLLALGLAMVILIPERQPMRTLLRDDAAALLVRRALPGVILLPIALGWLSIRGQQAELIDSAFGTALLVLALLVLLSALLWWSARAVRVHDTALQESQEQLAGILGSITDAFMSFDANWRFVFLNEQVESRLGKDRSELLGKSIWELFPDAVHSDAHAKLQRAMTERIRLEYEVYYPPWQQWFVEFAYPTPDGGLAVYSRDITDRKVAEAQLREAEQKFRMLANNIPQLAWMAEAGTDGHIHWFNQNWYDYTGTTLEQMQGHGWYAVHHPDHARRVIKKFAHHVREGLDWEDTFPLRGADGQFRWFLSRMSVIRNESRAVVRIFGTNTDVTEQIQMAGELRRLSAELSEADRRKDEFLATLAHELRNPLAPVRNAVQLLHLEAPETPSSQWALDVIDRQIRAMTRLIDDLMDVSRISRSKLELRKERVALEEVVQGAVETSLPIIEQHGHQLSLVLPAEPIILDADFTRLAQIFLNLLNNSAKYTEPGGRITFVAERQGSDIVVSVTDTGIGIPADKLPTIFEMFSQVESSLSRSHGGLGIGLCLVKRLVEMHGGSVEAHSEGPGQGSCFVVRLPIVIEQPNAFVTHKATAEPSPTSALRLLVVDDNRDAASSLGMLLKTMGNSVRLAHDGDEAVTAACEFRPQVVFLDIGLPKMNGYEVARCIRKEPWGKEIVLIAVTGWGQEEDRRKSQEAGFDQHMIKPVDPSALMELLAGLGTH